MTEKVPDVFIQLKFRLIGPVNNISVILSLFKDSGSDENQNRQEGTVKTMPLRRLSQEL